MFKTLKDSLLNLRFPLLAAFFIWIKTYLATLFKFDLTIESPMQQFILFISPLAVAMLVTGLALFFQGKKRNYVIIITNILLTIVLIGNILFYGFYNDFITLPILLQATNLGGLGSSIRELLNPFMLLLVVDIFILVFLMKKYPKFSSTEKINGLIKGFYFLLTAAIFTLNLGLAQADRPQLLTRSFDREYLVRYMGLFFYQGYDAFQSGKTSTQRALASGDQLTEVQNFIRSNRVISDSPLAGSMSGKNVVMITLESFQSFLIGAEINGEEVTPFLNEFIQRSYYFENFYHQTAQGKTSDSEFITETSLYPLSRGAVFFTHATNEFVTIPELLRDEGYYSTVLHANNASFWNRNVVYSSFGFDSFFTENSFEITDENSIGWGMNDVTFMEQSIDILDTLQQPFYAKLLTLTNHFPYEIDEAHTLIGPYDSGDGTFDRYFQTARYLDEALRVFVENLKESGLYENTVIVMYGDHYGQSENRYRPMAQFLGKDEITAADHIELQRVPFIVHLPGQTEGETISTVSGQVDIKPTILSLLGVDAPDGIGFGNDMFGTNHPNLVIFRDGSFVTDSYIYRGGTFFDKDTREEIEPPEDAERLLNRVEQELHYSDSIIYGNLLRFYSGNNHETGTIQTEIR